MLTRLVAVPSKLARAQVNMRKSHIFADEPLSGSGSDRPDLQHLLAAARRSPRPFDEILVDDTSRISRSMAWPARYFVPVGLLV